MLKLRGGLTKLPARPPAIRATPMKRTTRALHAAGPSLPQESPEKAELRCDLSSSDVTRNPTTSETPSVVTSSRHHLGNNSSSAHQAAQAWFCRTLGTKEGRRTSAGLLTGRADSRDPVHKRDVHGDRVVWRIGRRLGMLRQRRSVK
jgi:hypothetical protein